MTPVIISIWTKLTSLTRATIEHYIQRSGDFFWLDIYCDSVGKTPRTEESAMPLVFLDMK